MAKLRVRERSTGEGLVGERSRETRSVSRSKVLGSSMAMAMGWEGKEKGLVGWSGRDRQCDCVVWALLLDFGICDFVLLFSFFEFRLNHMFQAFPPF